MASRQSNRAVVPWSVFAFAKRLADEWQQHELPAAVQRDCALAIAGLASLITPAPASAADPVERLAEIDATMIRGEDEVVVQECAPRGANLDEPAAFEEAQAIADQISDDLAARWSPEDLPAAKVRSHAEVRSAAEDLLKQRVLLLRPCMTTTTVHHGAGASGHPWTSADSSLEASASRTRRLLVSLPPPSVIIARQQFVRVAPPRIASSWMRYVAQRALLIVKRCVATPTTGDTEPDKLAAKDEHHRCCETVAVTMRLLGGTANAETVDRHSRQWIRDFDPADSDVEWLQPLWRFTSSNLSAARTYLWPPPDAAFEDYLARARGVAGPSVVVRKFTTGASILDAAAERLGVIWAT